MGRCLFSPLALSLTLLPLLHFLSLTRPGVPLLDPVEDMKIKSKDLEKTVRKVEILEQRLYAHPLHTSEECASVMALCARKEQVHTSLDLWL